MHIEERCFKAFPLEPLDGVEHRVMLKFCGDNMTLPLFRLHLRQPADGPIIRLRATGSKIDFFRMGTQKRRDLPARGFHSVMRRLPQHIEAGRISKMLCQIREHRLHHLWRNGGGRRIICINVAFC